VDDVQKYGLDFSDYILGPNRGQCIPDLLVQSLEKAFDDIFATHGFRRYGLFRKLSLETMPSCS
jgi:hypothetical protein